MDHTTPQIKILEEKESTSGKYVVEPLERGYGSTLGNALRRVMLSSIEGAAITFVKIDKVLHEFSTIPGVKEDTTELLLNLKNLYVKVLLSPTEKFEPKVLSIHKKGEGRVTGADVQCPDNVMVVNPEVYLATISDENSTLDMELTVDMGRGYVLPDKQDRRLNQPIGVIPVGASFTPVRKVNYTVEATRVGFKTDYERLILEIVTNGTITPKQAVSRSANILSEYFRLFMDFVGASTAVINEPLSLSADGPSVQAPDARIEELDFSVRTYNCLKKANILTIEDLIQHPENDLMQIRNFGKKSLLEVREKLSILKLELKGGNVITITSDEEDDVGTLGSDIDEDDSSVSEIIEVEVESGMDGTAKPEEVEVVPDIPEEPADMEDPVPAPVKPKRGRGASQPSSEEVEVVPDVPEEPGDMEDPVPAPVKPKRGRGASQSSSEEVEVVPDVPEEPGDMEDPVPAPVKPKRGRGASQSSSNDNE